MIDLPINKAVIAVETESENPCGLCCFEILALGSSCIFDCKAEKRRDGKNVVYKTVDNVKIHHLEININGDDIKKRVTGGER